VKILVTGGAGFIGANLCRALVRENHVVVLDDLSSGRAPNISGVDVDLMFGSVLDRHDVRAAARGVGAIIHLAAVPSVPRSVEDPFVSHNVNATGALVVLEVAREVGAHVVLASSASVYGDNSGDTRARSIACRPASPHDVSKLAAESYTSAYAASFGLDTISFRLFNAFGPRQVPDAPSAAVVAAFAVAALRDEALVVQGDGEQSRDFTFVDSVVDVLVDAVNSRRVSPYPVDLAFGTRTTVNELARLVGELVGRDLDVRHVAPRPGDIRHSRACPDGLRELFPAARPVPLRTGLSRTLAWLSRHAEEFGIPTEARL
jgi:UDP-glucose 4-epimerase